jgi:hypothetical protein
MIPAVFQNFHKCTKKTTIGSDGGLKFPKETRGLAEFRYLTSLNDDFKTKNGAKAFPMQAVLHLGFTREPWLVDLFKKMPVAGFLDGKTVFAGGKDPKKWDGPSNYLLAFQVRTGVALG